MSIDVFSIQCDALDGAKLVGFKATEVLSRPFEVELFFTAAVGTDVRSAIGGRATLMADRDDGRGPMCWHGLLASIRLLHETGERALYRAALVPALWFLRQHVRSFVHTKRKVDAFAADTLKDGGLSGDDFQFHTHAGAYPVEEFVCQYRESHLDFLHRWFEREGLYYYFEHPEGAGATERMIVVDDKSHHHSLFGDGHVRYFPAAGTDGSAGECLRELSADFALLPASVAISDYNYANPAAPVAGEKGVSGIGRGKIREYGYRVFTEGEANRLAQIKAQSMACRELVLTASGSYLGLRAGYTFEVEDGPSDLPAKYLAIEVRHAGAVSGAAPMVLRYTGLDAKETYRVDVVGIPANVQYRAPQSTPWPRIYGFENGSVDGPAESQYAQIDEQGRYLVRFKFDVSDLPDGSTSTYLRMMQPHGGTTEGWHFPLRKGTEVMVSFQGGDPDRPVIAGVVPNAVQPSNVTNKNHTQNVLRTGGDNFLIMDDIDGQQLIKVGTPVNKTQYFMGGPTSWQGDVPPSDPALKDDVGDFALSYHLTTDGSAGFFIGGDWVQTVGGGAWVDVTGDVRVRYKSVHTLIVGANSNEFYGGARTTNIKNTYTQNANAGGSQNVTGDWTHSVSNGNTDKYGKWNTDVDGNWIASFGGVVSLSAGGTMSVTVADGKFVVTSPEIVFKSPLVTIDGAKIETKSPTWYKTTPKSFEFYGFKESAGIQKFDAAAVGMSITGIKRDTTGVSLSLTGIKSDAAGVSVSVSNMHHTSKGTELSNETVKSVYGAIETRIKGLLKLG